MLQDIVTFIFDSGIKLYQSFEISFGDFSFNLLSWIIGFAALLLVAEIVGRILE